MITDKSDRNLLRQCIDKTEEAQILESVLLLLESRTALKEEAEYIRQRILKRGDNTALQQKLLGIPDGQDIIY